MGESLKQKCTLRESFSEYTDRNSIGIESEKIDYKYLYEKAIEERKNLQSGYNHWMNAYSIINGALFAALYNISGKDDSTLLSLISITGFVSSLFWCASACGFYRWIISWITVVAYYENKLKNISCEKDNNVFLYRLFGTRKWDCKTQPFSTPKLNIFFSVFLAIMWEIVLLLKGNCEVFIISLLILLAFIFIVCSYCRESDLDKTHFNIIQNSETGFLDEKIYKV